VVKLAVRDGFRVVSGHGQYHATVLARQLNPKAGETIPARVLESENQVSVLAQLKILKFFAFDAVALSQKSGGAV
jgi:hypothetical protein